MTMLHTLLILIATPQAAPDTIPVPISAAHAQEIIVNLQSRANYRLLLLHDCMSDDGATLVADDWASDRRRDSPDFLRRRAMQQELTDAARAEPLDQARLEQAVTEEAREDARQRTDRAERKIAILRLLSPADQVIFARRLSYSPPKLGVSCKPPPDTAPVSAPKGVVP